VNELPTTQLAPIVLLLTDFSAESEGALKWAGQLAERRGAELKMVGQYSLAQIDSYARTTDILLVVLSKGVLATNKEAINELLDQLHKPVVIVPTI